MPPSHHRRHLLLVVLLSSRVALACGFGSGQIQINWMREISQSRAAVPASRKPGILRPDDQRPRTDRRPGHHLHGDGGKRADRAITIVRSRFPKARIPCDQRPTIPRHLRYWVIVPVARHDEKVGSYGDC